MASELKPWRYEIKYGPDGEDSYSWVYDDQGVMVAPMRTHKAKEVVDHMNTRPAPVDANLLASNPVDDKIAPDTDGNAPAATDTGLVTYAHDNGTLSGLSRNEHGPWCLRSQAEELLAAEREAQQRLLDIIEEANDDKEALEAKLTAAEKALEPFVSFFNEAMKGFTEGYAERTPSDKPVLGWNNAYLLMRHFIEARAVLGGKP
ncbi:hypothetical protein [Brucella intermedia]|uniref:hypothetical protein n=1 Tax=Brucella intermedia TaxID=94625 RepID=UPI00124CA27B|nr:hypothetical protein [Brucella intermedia]KAB2709676.1 hypothetical protein F9K80_10415 [Brucella intermedia]